MFVATKAFLTKGVGKHKEKLASFEMALRDAGLAPYNLVRVSSIFPPFCRLIPASQGLLELTEGEIVFCVLSQNETNEPNRMIGASVGVAIPRDQSKYGYLSEHHSYGEVKEKAADYAEDLAASMLSTVLGVEFNPDLSWDEKKEIWKIDGKIVKTTSVTQTARGDKKGLWTTVVTGCVLLK